MALFWLIILAISIYYVTKHGKFSTAANKSRSSLQEEDPVQRSLRIMREADEKRRRGELKDPTLEKSKAEVAKMFKPGYQTDPKWLEGLEELQATIQRSREIADKDLQDMEQNPS